MIHRILVDNPDFTCINAEIVDDVPLGALADSDNGVCILTCLTELISINKAVNKWIALWVMQENQVVNGYYTFGMGCFSDIKRKFVAQAMIDGYVIFFQIVGDADGTPHRTAFSPYPFGRDAEQFRAYRT